MNQSLDQVATEIGITLEDWPDGLSSAGFRRRVKALPNGLNRHRLPSYVE
jgi:hypothetical protein